MRRRTDRFIVILGLAQIATTVLLAFGIRTVANTNSRVTRDEHQTCVVQSRGLPASHELVAIMSDLHAILTFPISPAERRQQAATMPHRQIVAEFAVLADLNSHLASYDALEHRQPHTRVC